MDREWLEEELQAGRSFEALAAEAGLSASTVSYWARRHGLRSDHAARHRRRTPLTREALEDLVARHATVREIADVVERSPTTVRYWLRRHGLRTTPAARRRSRSVPEVRSCPKHGETEFVRAKGSWVCGRCRSQAVSDWRRRAKRLLVVEAGGACRLCAYDRCVEALQFHHVDPEQKSFSLGGRGLAHSIATLRAEAAKCVLLCANCHAEVEAGHVALP